MAVRARWRDTGKSKSPRRTHHFTILVILPLLASFALAVVGCRSGTHDSGPTTSERNVILQTPIVPQASLSAPIQLEPLSPNHSPDPRSRKETHPDTERLLKMVSLTDNRVLSADTLDLDVIGENAHFGVRHAGVNPDLFRDLSQAELLILAMQHSEVIRSLGVRVLNSPNSVTTTYDPAIRATDPFFGPAAALAEFDSQITSSLTTQNNDRVFNNATLGGDVQELVQDYAELNSTWRKRNTWGTQFELGSVYTYDSNNRTGNRFPSYWETQLEFGVRQPLLQGAGRQFNLIAGPNARPGFNFSNGLWIARINTRISQADFNIALRDYFLELYTAYWDLHRQYAVYDAAVQAREVAYNIWQTVLSKKQSGLMGGEAYKEAQSRATYYRYTREVQAALGGGDGTVGLYSAERTLRRLIGLPPTNLELLRPVDSPAEARFEFDLPTSVAKALTHRSELSRQRLELQNRNLKLLAAKNFMLPQLDLIGRTRLRGFGDDLDGDGARFSSATDDLLSLDHQEWQFGVEMGVSPQRRQAKAAIRNASLQLQRERSVLREQERAVAYEVEEAIAEIQSAYVTMQSSIARVDAGQQRLESSEALYAAGKIQLEFLIDATEELVRSRNQLAVDRSRYSLALVRISRTTGTLLSDLGVHSSPCGSATEAVH
ncbi:TolC family protein [Aporhodopirellula aestuarii]|uniref:TolC family protein n=1 Tax=Aporhodopirellula aestuarii TaxID=2950107 RepID=A0ABT0UBD3_9BACT|nr:TolC family protein [Aporhodopirellula aestuarii]MCM2374329.1 TolC family protein [Aporhodopirellula aestuarii]